jgi:drug/metabolite transporter (DMT)-like permease
MALALVLVALSAVFHAAWNILLKSAGDPLRAATVGMTAATVVGVPLAAGAWLLLGRVPIPLEVWALGIGSGVVETAYFILLSSAYRRGDLSLVYPLARGTAPLLAVAIAASVLGEQLPTMAWLGVLLVITGLLLVQRPWRLLQQQGRADRAAAGLALLTGLAIASYTAIDSVAVGLASPIVYAGILFTVGTAGLLGIDAVRRTRAGPAARDMVGRGARPEAARSVLGGLLMFTGYGLVLVALSLAPLAVVAPLRESAIVFTAGWGVARMGEARAGGGRTTRIAGSVLIVAGIVALALSR